MRGILGRKVGMTQLFDASGAIVPVTIIEAGPCYVTQVKTADSDGYNAVQIGFDEVPERKLTKGQLGHLKRANTPRVRRLREVRYLEVPTRSLGDGIKSDNETDDTVGYVVFNGGAGTISSGDDGIHAEGDLAIAGGTVTVAKSAEGIEGANIAISARDFWDLGVRARLFASVTASEPNR